ncbi:SAM-dependent methyltransferase [Methylobacterium sp. ARG-1]|uniref:SAM-dependent methyltransferase n=1 Tax=Methylobacterium sp. ARG-1 TaxID=1692501 RepID=UPI000AC5CC19|nr:SAM-dependent methyltransferase [Methylobacterium sp. ARG-1]
MRDRKPESRRRLLQAGGAVAASAVLGIGSGVGAETDPAVPAETPTGRRSKSLDTEYFKGMYATESDPWRFASSPYERDKYAATLAALPRARYASGLEVGCSIGVFTRELCPRCDALVGLDVVPSVLDAARARCAGCPNVRFELAAVPVAWPDGRFDLIVISEVAYYLDRADLARLVARVRGAVLPEADIVLVHWLGVTHYPLSGDEAAEGFIADAQDFARVLKQSRTAAYRLDVLRVTRADPKPAP